jgi:hypothetical protein
MFEVFSFVVGSSLYQFVYYILFLQEQKASGGVGDLMADLHAKLSMRRKVGWCYCV